MLIDLTRSLGLSDNVKFNNRFLSNAELVRYLAATDVYIMPYLGKDQIVSGTLAYAVGCGKAVIATPFTYALEMLANGRGCHRPFRDAEAIGSGVERTAHRSEKASEHRGAGLQVQPEHDVAFGRTDILRAVPLRYVLPLSRRRCGKLMVRFLAGLVSTEEARLD